MDSSIGAAKALKRAKGVDLVGGSAARGAMRWTRSNDGRARADSGTAPRQFLKAVHDRRGYASISLTNQALVTEQSIELDQSFERRQVSQPDGRSLLLYESPMFEVNKCVGQVVDTQSQQVGYKPRTEAIRYDGWIASFVAIVVGYRG
jgi:hypothetical protein